MQTRPLKPSKTGVGGGQGVAGLVLGYLTLAGYLIPFLLLGSIGAGAWL